MIKLEDLLKSADRAVKNKRKSKETVKFMLKKERNTVNLLNAINNRTYVHDGNYAFVVLIPKPREIFATCFKNRIVHHYIYERILPLIEKHVPRRTFSNRKNLGAFKAINQVVSDIYELSNGYKEDCWIMKIDVKGYFPNAIWEVAYNKLKTLIENEYVGDDKEDLIYLLKTCLFANPNQTCEKRGDLSLWRFIEPQKSLFNKPYGTGGAIGWLIWQIAMLYYLVDLDNYLYNCDDIRYVRFVDDITIIGKDKKSTLKHMDNIRKIIYNCGCTLNEQKFYFQHYSKGLEFLGSHIKYDRLYLNNKTIYRMLCKIRFLNSVNNKTLYCDKFLCSMNSYLGMLKTKTEYKTICRILEYIDEKWFTYFKFNKKKLCFNKIKNKHV